MIRVSTITVKSADPRVTARFWRDLLDYEVAPNHSESILLVGDGPSILVQPAVESLGPGVVHLDLRPDDHDHAVERALSLGARRIDVGQRHDEGWEVLTDPTGIVFCILESADAHAQRCRLDAGTPTTLD